MQDGQEQHFKGDDERQEICVARKAGEKEDQTGDFQD